MFCQFDYLRNCIPSLPGSIRRALDELPESLDETYTRILEEIKEQKWECAHRLFQCVAAASRPLLVSELAQFLAFKSEAGSTPTFPPDCRLEDLSDTVISTCSSLLAVAKPVDGPPVVQFPHFTAKEYLTSARLAKAKDKLSRFRISMTQAHTIAAQGCLGILLYLDKNVSKDSLKKFPLAEYAAEHWVGHARFKSVSSTVQDEINRLFDPRRHHISVWVWIYDPEDPRRRSGRSERPIKARATPLHYAASCGMYDVAEFLIVVHSQNVNAQGFDKKETPLHVASRRGHVDVVRLLLEHGASAEAQDDDKCTPLLLASQFGYSEVVQCLLEHGANKEARDHKNRTPLLLASYDGHEELACILLKHNADTEARDYRKRTSLLLASLYGHVELVRILLKHNADKEAQDCDLHTPLLLASQYGHVEVARVLLEHKADTKAQDRFGSTAYLLASQGGHVELAKALLKSGADTEARKHRRRPPLIHSVGRWMGGSPSSSRTQPGYGSSEQERPESIVDTKTCGSSAGPSGAWDKC